MKLAFFETTTEEQTFFSHHLRGHELLFFPEPFTSAFVSRCCDADVLSVFIHSKITAADLSRFTNLKLITTRSTGFDHIDVEACKKKGIPVATVTDYGVHTVAEHTFALLLGLGRRLKNILADKESYLKIASVAFKGLDLSGKTIGVIGTGKIGLAVIRIAQGFGMKVLAYDVIKNEQAVRELGFVYTGLDTLLSSSDVLTLHVPALPETHHLINRKRLSQIKKGAFLINTSRGSTIETAALFEGLDKGIFAGVGLDVVEEERLLPDPAARATLQRLASHPRVLLTPHIAYCTEEAVQRIMENTLQHIKRVL